MSRLALHIAFLALPLMFCLLDTGCGGGGSAPAGRGGGMQDDRPRDTRPVGGGRMPRQPDDSGSGERTRAAIGTGDTDDGGPFPGLYETDELPLGNARRFTRIDPTEPGADGGPSFDTVERSGDNGPRLREVDTEIPGDVDGDGDVDVDDTEDTTRGTRRAAGGEGLLSMPLISQRKGGGKYPGAYCGPTSVRMVLAHFGIKAGADEVALKDYGAGPMYVKGEGSTHAGMAAALKHYGLNAELGHSRSLSTLRAATAKGHPVIVNVKGNYGPFYTEGHILVVVGFTADGDVIVNDSAGGVRRTLDKRRFLNTWQGLAIEVSK